MRLIRVTVLDTETQFHFVRLRADNVPLDELLIVTAENSAIQKIEIRQNERGDCAIAGDGTLLYCTGWETESEAQQASAWSKHFPQPATIGKQDLHFAHRIFADLASKISDKYLRHLLRIYIESGHQVYFDASLYSVEAMPDTVSHSGAKEPAQVPAPISVTQSWHDIWLNFRLFILRKRQNFLFAGILLSLNLIGYWFFFVRDPLPEDPALWPQPAADEIYTYRTDYAGLAHARRHRDFASIAKADLFPILHASRRQYKHILDEAGRNRAICL